MDSSRPSYFRPILNIFQGFPLLNLLWGLLLPLSALLVVTFPASPSASLFARCSLPESRCSFCTHSTRFRSIPTLQSCESIVHAIVATFQRVREGSRNARFRRHAGRAPCSVLSATLRRPLTLLHQHRRPSSQQRSPMLVLLQIPRSRLGLRPSALGGRQEGVDLALHKFAPPIRRSEQLGEYENFVSKTKCHLKVELSFKT